MVAAGEHRLGMLFCLASLFTPQALSGHLYFILYRILLRDISNYFEGITGSFRSVENMLSIAITLLTRSLKLVETILNYMGA